MLTTRPTRRSREDEIARKMELCCPDLMEVISGWNYFCSMFRRHLFAASSGAVPLVVRWTLNTLPAVFTWLPERPLLKMPHTDGGETSSRNNFNHRPHPSSSDSQRFTNDLIGLGASALVCSPRNPSSRFQTRLRWTDFLGRNKFHCGVLGWFGSG